MSLVATNFSHASVERLCDYIGIIHKGRLVAQGSLADLRLQAIAGQSLEEMFLSIVGAGAATAPSLGWLGR